MLGSGTTSPVNSVAVTTDMQLAATNECDRAMPRKVRKSSD